MYRGKTEGPRHIEYLMSTPLWLKDHPEYKQYLNTVCPLSWDTEG
jgi:hypothetical protein